MGHLSSLHALHLVFEKWQSATKAHRVIKVKLHSFITSALGGGEWPTSRSSRLIPDRPRVAANWCGTGQPLLFDEYNSGARGRGSAWKTVESFSTSRCLQAHSTWVKNSKLPTAQEAGLARQSVRTFWRKAYRTCRDSNPPSSSYL